MKNGFCEKRKYKLTGITPLLGAQPSNPDVRTAYILSKCPDPVAKEIEEEALGEQEKLRKAEEYDDRTLTVFWRNPKTGAMAMKDNSIRGYFKGALQSLSAALNMSTVKSKVDKYLFVSPLFCDIMQDGKPVMDFNEINERPIRASTPMGERQALIGSEAIYDPWSIEIEITLFPNNGTRKSCALNWAAVESALDFGEYCGIGQFRNGSYGRFTWERVD